MVQIYRVGSLWQKKGKKWIPSANFSFNNGSRGEARLLPQDGRGGGGGAALCNCPTLSHTRLSWLTGSSDVQKNLAERLEEKKYSCPALLQNKGKRAGRMTDGAHSRQRLNLLQSIYSWLVAAGRVHSKFHRSSMSIRSLTERNQEPELEFFSNKFSNSGQPPPF